MRYLFSSFVFLAASVMALSALADPADKDAKKGDDKSRAEMREKMLKEFDKDGDGKLSDEERETARAKMRELHGDKKGKGEGGEGKRKPEGGRGPEARGGPGGPPHMPKPEELFAKFDKDSDEKLSKEEFMALANFVHEHMPPPPGLRGDGRGPEGRGPDGSPGGPRFGRGPDGPPRDGDGPNRRRGGPDGERRPGREGRPPREDGDKPGPPPEKSEDKAEKGDKADSAS